MMSAETPTLNARSLPSSQVLAPSQAGIPTRTSAWTKQLYQCVCVAAVALVAYFLISHFLVQSVRVVGMSMFPTLRDSQFYLLNRWIYLVRSPEPGDVVVIRDPGDNGLSVKRIVAKPGDSVFLSKGSVYLNGCRLQEAYLPSGTPTYPNPSLREQSMKCGKDQFIVLGDNRMNSTDSRFYGPVPRGNILGLVIR